MNDKAKAVENSLINKLEDSKEQAREGKEERIAFYDDPMNGLKETIAGYLTQRFSALQDEQDFGLKIREKLLSKIDEAKFSELLNLFNSQKNRETEAVSSLLEFFKPSQGDKSPLIGEARSKDDSSPEERVFNESSPEMLQAVNKLSQLIATINVKKEEE